MNIRINWDAMGIATSLACAIHCAILPLILTTLPVFGVNIVQNMTFECGMIVLAILIGFYSLWHGYRRHHRQLLPVMIFSLGALALIGKQIWHNYEYWFLGPAVVAIISAHWLNYRFCRKASPAREHKHGTCSGHEHHQHGFGSVNRAAEQADTGAIVSRS